MRNPSLYLIDSSVWIEVARRQRDRTPVHERVEELLSGGLVVTVGLVRLELLGAISDESELRRRVDVFGGLPSLPTSEERWDEAARLGSALRRQGLTIPNTDLLIAAVAMAFDATVLHRDRHFDLIAQHAPLAVESHVASGSGGLS